jgi:hypothetical protein
MEKHEYDSNGQVIAFVWNNDPNHKWSWREERDSEGHVISRTVANDPGHIDSWREERDSKNRRISVTFAEDPTNEWSWCEERDSNGRVVSFTYAQDPNNECSWRGEFLFKIDDYNVMLLTDGRIKVGCQAHTIDHWRDHWESIALNHGMNIETSRLGMEKLESILTQNQK